MSFKQFELAIAVAQLTLCQLNSLKVMVLHPLIKDIMKEQTLTSWKQKKAEVHCPEFFSVFLIGGYF